MLEMRSQSCIHLSRLASCGKVTANPSQIYIPKYKNVLEVLYSLFCVVSSAAPFAVGANFKGFLAMQRIKFRRCSSHTVYRTIHKITLQKLQLWILTVKLTIASQRAPRAGIALFVEGTVNGPFYRKVHQLMYLLFSIERVMQVHAS